MSRFHTGQRVRGFPDQTWNRLVDELHAPREIGVEALAGVVAELAAHLCSGQVIADVRPDADLVEHGVAILTEPTFQPSSPLSADDVGGKETLQPPVVEVTGPTSANLTNGTAVVTLEPIKANAIGRAVVLGLAWARVNVQTAGDTTCTPQDGDAETLLSGSGSIRIVWAELQAESTKTGEQWCLVLLGSIGDATIQDMLYGVVGSYDATNKVITTSGTPTALPTDTPTIGAGIKVYDREGTGFSASDTFYAIKSEAVHTDGTHGQVDWVVLPTAAGTPIEKLTIAKKSASQSAGDPVSPLSTGNYFDATIGGGATSVWALLDDNKRLGRIWLPALAEFEGIYTGVYDPHDDDAGITSDPRPLYRMQPPSDGETIALVTTTASAADWSSPPPTPSTDGRCTTYKRDSTGSIVADQTGVAFENYRDTTIAAGTKVTLEEFQGRLFAVPFTASGGVVKKGIVTESGGIPAAQELPSTKITPGSGTVQLWDLSSGSYSAGSTETWYNWMWSDIAENHPVLGIADEDGNVWVVTEGCLEVGV